MIGLECYLCHQHNSIHNITTDILNTHLYYTRFTILLFLRQTRDSPRLYQRDGPCLSIFYNMFFGPLRTTEALTMSISTAQPLLLLFISLQRSRVARWAAPYYVWVWDRGSVGCLTTLRSKCILYERQSGASKGCIVPIEKGTTRGQDRITMP